MGEGRSIREIMRLMQPDGMHPNAEGVQAIVDHIGPVVLELVAEARARGDPRLRRASRCPRRCAST